jgi:hypothetical protein
VKLEAVEEKPSETILTLVTCEHDGKIEPLEKLALKNEGILRFEISGKPIDPIYILRFPHIDGKKFEEVNNNKDFKRDYSFIAFGPETVGVPAGRYKAIRVEHELSLSSIANILDPFRVTDWYAEGIGCVKRVIGDAVEELESFTRGDK